MSEYSPPLLYKTTFVPLGKDSTLALDPDDCPIILKKPGLTFVKDNANPKTFSSPVNLKNGLAPQIFVGGIK